MKDMIKVGTITSTHGIRGEVKIVGDNPCFSPSFKESLYIDTNPVVEVHIKTVKNQNGKLIVSFKEFDNINQVECFKNYGIYAKRESLGELEEDEVYLTDLIDMEVSCLSFPSEEGASPAAGQRICSSVKFHCRLHIKCIGYY